MKTRIALFAISATVLSASAAPDPYIGYIYPAGIQAGATNRLVIGGQNLNRAKGVRFSRKGLRVIKIENVPNFQFPSAPQRKHLMKWLDGIAAGKLEEPALPDDPHLDEWRSNSWWSALGTLDAGKIAIVERDLYVPKNALQSTPSLRQKLLVTVAADTSAGHGRGELCLYGPGGMSAPRPFFVSAAPHVAEPFYAPSHRPAPELAPVAVPKGGEVVLDGQIMPGATDAFPLRLTKGCRYTFRVTARELQPYVGDAVPGFFNASLALKDGDGATVAFADDEKRFRPDPVMRFEPKADGVYRLEIHDVLYRGREDFVYAVAVAEGRAEEASRPGDADGVVLPGKVARMEFRIERPGRMSLEVFARRIGSPLDAVLTLRRSPDGPVLARWDDCTNTVFVGTIPQGECDPCGEFDFREPGRYVAEITDRTGHGGPDYFWRLHLRRPEPWFEVYSARSTLPLSNANPLNVKFHVLRRGGFDGDVRLAFPEGVKCVGGVATSKADVVTAKLSAVGRREVSPRPVKVFATAKIDGVATRVPVVPCDEYEQAFAWKHLVPAETFLMTSTGGGKPKPKPRATGSGRR